MAWFADKGVYELGTVRICRGGDANTHRPPGGVSSWFTCDRALRRAQTLIARGYSQPQICLPFWTTHFFPA
jgi:hypothetical protein